MRLYELLTENRSPLFAELKAMKPQFVSIAQKIYDRWDGSDYRNGICDDISEKLSAFINRKKFKIGAIASSYGRNQAGNHAYAVVFNKTESYLVDIPYWKYETARMITDPKYGKQLGWKKIKGARFTDKDVRIVTIPRQKFMRWNENDIIESVNLLREGQLHYTEKGSLFSHGDIKYDLNKIFKIVEQLPIGIVAVKDLDWILKYSKPESQERIDRANISVPIIVMNHKETLLVVDGLHRLAKAVQNRVEALPVKLISHKLMNRARKDV